MEYDRPMIATNRCSKEGFDTRVETGRCRYEIGLFCPDIGLIISLRSI